jgi:integrase
VTLKSGPAPQQRSGPGTGGNPMQPQPSTPSPHRTDSKRGPKRRVAPGVFERADRFLVGYSDVNGVDHLKTLGWIKSDRHPDGLTLRQAKAERERLRVRTGDGTLPAPSALTFGQVAEEFLADFQSRVVAGECSERTASLYEQRYRTHLEPILATRPLQSLRPRDFTELLRNLRGRGVGASTLRGTLLIASRICSYAIRNWPDVISVSPTDPVERPKVRVKSEPRYLDAAEIRELLQHAPERYRTLLATAVFTGARQSELLGLTWNDVDFDGGRIQIRAQLSRATRDKPARRVPLKTGAGQRDIPLIPQLAQLLKQHKEAMFAQGHAKPDDYVFSTWTGRPFYYRNVSSRGLDPAADAAGLNSNGEPRVTFHDLRHTFASHLIVDLRLDAVRVSKMLGHARPSITTDVYAGLIERARHGAELREAMADSAFAHALD